MVEVKSVMLITLLVLTADWMFENTHFEMWRCWGRRNLTTSVRPPLISTRWRIRWLQFCQNKKIMMIISMTIKIKVIMLMSKFPGQDSDGLPEHSCSRSREKEGWTWKEVNIHTLYIKIDLQGYPIITLLGTLKNKSKWYFWTTLDHLNLNKFERGNFFGTPCW